MFREIFFISRMNLQNLPNRVGPSSVIVVGMAGIVAVLVSMLAMANGFRQVLEGSGREDRAIVLGAGATTDLASVLKRESVTLIESTPGIKRNTEGRALASPEVLMLISLPKSDDGSEGSIAFRGVTPAAFAVHSELELLSGRMFRPAMHELIVGKSAMRQYQGLKVGERVKLRGTDWSIVGVFAANGSSHESELFADAETVMSAYQRNVYQNVTVQLESAAHLVGFKQALQTHPSLQVEVMGERAFYAQQGKGVADLLSLVIVVVGGFMAIGALFGALNTMYSAVSSRTTEIATLRALGFGSRAVVVSVFIEALCLAAAGAAVGALLASVLFGGTMVSSFRSSLGGEVVFDLLVTPDIVIKASVGALVIAFIGALPPAIRAARVPVVTALRMV